MFCFTDNAQNMVNLFTDNTFLWGTQKTISLMLGHGVKVYQYILTHQAFGLAHRLVLPYGVCHAEDLLFLFDPYQIPLLRKDREVGDLMARAWTNFAKTGDPNDPSTPHVWERCLKGQVSSIHTLFQRRFYYGSK